MMYETNAGGVRWLPRDIVVGVVPEGEYYRRRSVDEVGQVVRRIELNGAKGVEIRVLCSEGNHTGYVLTPVGGHIVDCVKQKSGDDYTVSSEDVLNGRLLRKASTDTSIEVLLVLNPVDQGN